MQTITENKIDRLEAEKILKQHGIEPDDPTGYDGRDWLEKSSFDAQVGVKGEYNLTEVLLWLGRI